MVSLIWEIYNLLKFIYSEKAKKLCEIFTLLLSYVVPDKSKVKISLNFVAFSDYMNFKKDFLSPQIRFKKDFFQIFVAF